MSINQNIDSALKNPYLMTVLKVSLALYAAQYAPNPPKVLVDLFQNTFVKIGLIALLIYLEQKDIQLAIIVAIIFVLIMNVAAGRGVLESYTNFKPEFEKYGHQTYLDPYNAIHPSCMDVTLDDILAAFDNDPEQVQQNALFAYRELLNNMKDKSTKEKVMNLGYQLGMPYNMNPFEPHHSPKVKQRYAAYLATLFALYGFQIPHSKGVCKTP